MKKRYVIPIAGACALAWVGIGRKYLHSPVAVVDVRVKAINAHTPTPTHDSIATTDRLPERATAADPRNAIAPSLNPSVQPSAVQAEAVQEALSPAEATVFDARRFVDDIDRQKPLTEQQREDLARILKHVGMMQARIDQHADADERRKLQAKLVYQLIVRLRMILGEDAIKEVALALTDKVTRIQYE